MCKKRMIIGLTGDKDIKKGLQNIGADAKNDHLLVADFRVKQTKEFFSAVSGFGRVDISIFSLGFLKSFIYHRPEKVVFIISGSFRNMRIFQDIHRLAALLGYKVEVGVCDLYSIFLPESFHLYNYAAANPVIDYIIAGIVVFPLVILLLFNITSGLYCAGGMLFLYLGFLLHHTYFKFRNYDFNSGAKSYYCKISYARDERTPEVEKSEILWEDIKGVAYCNYSVCSFGEDKLKKVFDYEVTVEGYRAVCPPVDNLPAGIAVLGGSVAFGLTVSQGANFVDILQNSYRDQKFINVALRKGSMSIVQMKMLPALFHEHPGLHTVIIMLIDAWDLQSLPNLYHLLEASFEHHIPLCYYRQNKLQINSKFDLRPCIAHKLPLGGAVYRGLFNLYKKFVIPDLNHQEMTKYALNEMRRMCVENGKELLIAVGQDSHSYESFLQENGFNWVDATKISDVEHMEDDPARWTFSPYDTHPNEKAHELFADNISGALGELLAGRSGVAHNDVVVGASVKNYNTELDVYPLF